MVKQKTPLFIALALLMYMYGLSLFTTRPRKASGARSEEEEKSYITFHKHTVYSYIKGLLMQKTFLLNCIPFAYSPNPLTLSVRSLPINYKSSGARRKDCLGFHKHTVYSYLNVFLKAKKSWKIKRLFISISTYCLKLQPSYFMYMVSPLELRGLERPLGLGQRKKKNLVLLFTKTQYNHMEKV